MPWLGPNTNKLVAINKLKLWLSRYIRSEKRLGSKNVLGLVPDRKKQTQTSVQTNPIRINEYSDLKNHRRHGNESFSHGIINAERSKVDGCVSGEIEKKTL
jgi:hypothetical protein